MRVGIVGCGFVADYYLQTLAAYPELELAGVFDRDSRRAELLAHRHGTRVWSNLAGLLDDERVPLVLNLTNPRSHFDVTKACLEAGKHVYTEKPLATTFAQAACLAELATSKGLQLSSGPCSLLGEAAQTVWKALRERRVGTARLVYAEMDDGMVHRTPYRTWRSPSGIPWPWKDEFEVGCTLEHAGYYLTWLTAFFGPAQHVTAFASQLIGDKETDVPLEIASPDFSVACIQFASGVVARVTSSIVAPHDHSLRIVGDDGVLGVADCWHYDSPVWLRRPLTIRRRTILSPWKTRVPLVRRTSLLRQRGSQRMDFARGVAELAAAIVAGRDSRLSTLYSLHNTELALAIQNACGSSSSYQLKTSFDPVAPMDWAD